MKTNPILFEKLSSQLLTPKFVRSAAYISIAIAYLRIFFGAEVTDEPYHVACAALTALGDKFYVNDSYFGQTASLVYEPFIYIYNKLIGTTGVMLFSRHLYFLLSLVCGYCFYRLMRKMISADLALLISTIPIVFIHYTIPILGYNTLGCFGFGIGSALTIEAELSQRRSLGLLGAWAFAVCVFVYPSFVLGAALIYFSLAARHWLQQKKQPILLIQAALVSGLLFCFFWGVTIFRFGFADIPRSIETTQAYGSGNLSVLEDKITVIQSFIGNLTPPLWTLLPIALFLGFLLAFRLSWTWVIPLIAGLFFFMVPLPNITLISPLFITFVFCLGCVSLLPNKQATNSENDKNRDELSWLMILTCLILGVAAFFTSANHILATPLATQFGLMFVIFRVAGRVSRASIVLPMLAVLLLLNFYSYSYAYREEAVQDMTTLMETGPYAGIFTSEYKAQLFYQIERDVREVSKGAKTILFYDNFPAGFLFSNLRPATRSIFIHPVPYGNWDRHVYTEYYADPAKRPDVFLQFDKFPYAQSLVVTYRPGVPDDFFNYLPETGDYELVGERTFYKVWRKKSLPPLSN